ncbi:MAG TPA: hypothetical protein VF659_16095 [Pyrinomonadaceae bacterium]|jgi:hypothetical protein
MNAPFQLLERQTLLAPLGLRFRDAATGELVGGGLSVTVYPTDDPARRSVGFVNRSGVYAVRHAAGLRDVEFGSGDNAFWDAPPPKRAFTVEVYDTEGRFLPYSFQTALPVRGLHTWTWPLGEASAQGSPEPASVFSDTFDDGVRDARWKLGTLTPPASAFDDKVTVAEAGGRLEITPRSSAGVKAYNGYVSVSNWNLTDARATAVVVQTTTNKAQTVFTLALDANNWFRFLFESAKLNFQTKVAGAETSTSIPADAAQQRFWRLRHDRAGDQMIFETSSDGAAWAVRRVVPRQFSVKSLTVELNAGTASSVASPGKAVFGGVVLESNPAQALPLYSAPTRPVTGGLAVLRAALWDAAAGAPAAWALLEARVNGQPTARGYADAAGRVALVFPYPEPASFVQQNQPQPATPFTRQEWPVSVFASYKPRSPAPPVPDLKATLAQPRATLWADAARTTPLTKVTLRSGQQLVVRSNEAATDSAPDGRPLPVLLITPAG